MLRFLWISSDFLSATESQMGRWWVTVFNSLSLHKKLGLHWLTLMRENNISNFSTLYCDAVRPAMNKKSHLNFFCRTQEKKKKANKLCNQYRWLLLYCSEHWPQRLKITVMIIDKPLNFVTCSEAIDPDNTPQPPPPKKTWGRKAIKYHTHTRRHRT